jgi:hypothetical protein
LTGFFRAVNLSLMSADSPQRIMQFAWGFAPPLILEVAIRNRVFDFLDATEHSIEDVAELTNVLYEAGERS